MSKKVETVSYKLKIFETALDAVRASTRVDRRRAKEIFVKRFSESMFEKQIQPTLEQSGVIGFFTRPPNNFVRYYIDQVAAITDSRHARIKEIEDEASGNRVERNAEEELARLKSGMSTLEDPSMTPLLRKVIEKPVLGENEFDVKLELDRKEDYGTTRDEG